ncbi:cobyric acid synthase [Antricoccus suffuscus]|nr:cobyric acid synthase [Antricoccus suffuscus]
MSHAPGRGLLVAGTSSDAGKSLVTTGICRFLARQGLAVAPFKAQNMSNNSMVCADGAEIGRAQYLQAQAARAVPTSAMNPVLLKPGSDRRSFVVVRGKADGVLEAGEFASGRGHLAAAAFTAYRELQEQYDVIVCEGAGSPAEINLRSGDYVNMGLAREFDLPVVVVGDIDRGGVFASLYGTVELLEPADRALVKAFIINKFRGDESLLRPGLERLSELTGRPFLGVIPWMRDMWLDSEDTLEVGRWTDADGGTLRVAVVRLPRISNATDVDALAAEPGVAVAVTIDPAAIRSADLVVLPGSRATVSDLHWLQDSGIADALRQRANQELPILGICGGYQMLARTLDDSVESGAGVVEGLGLLPTAVRFEDEKTLGRPQGSWRSHVVEAYEIHHGITRTIGDGGSAIAFLDGIQLGTTWGTTWHGTLENDAFRRAWLVEVAAMAGSEWEPARDAPGFGERRERMIDALADAIEENLDTEALLDMVGVRR